MNPFEQLEKLKMSAATSLPQGLSAFGSVAPPQLSQMQPQQQNQQMYQFAH